jgi:hypothetical protein
MMQMVYSSLSKKKFVMLERSLFLFLSLVALQSIAQDYARKLDWQIKPRIISTIDGKQISQPTFTNAGHSEEKNMLAVYVERIPASVAGDVSVELVNAVYSPVTLPTGSDVYLSSKVEVRSAMAFQKKQPRVLVEMIPFRKNDAGQVEKLETFTLRVRITPQSQKRSGNAYADNSVLASGRWFKIAVSNEGMYKLDYNFIKNKLNLDPGSFSLNTLAVYGNGGGMVPDENNAPRYDDLAENPTLLQDNNSNNRFDEGDYFLFYGQMPDEWKYDAGGQTFSHLKNLYTDKTYYFITPDAGTGKRVPLQTNTSVANKTITQFDEHAYRDVDEESVLKSGKIWLGDKMTSFNNTNTFNFNFPNLVTSSPVRLKSSVAAKTSSGSNTQVSINGQQLINHNEPGISAGSYPPGALPYIASAVYNATSDAINVGYTFNISSDPTGTAAVYIDWFELLLKRGLSMSGDFMSFRSIESIGSGNISQFVLNNANGNTRVWNVTDISSITQMGGTLSGSAFSFNATTDDLEEFVAFNSTANFTTPEYVGQVANQNLHAVGEPDMIIVTHDDFEAASNDLADFHRTFDGLSVSVVRVSQIYNEFGSGRPDISATRDFMKMLYDRAGTDTSKMPQYLLLMGDGSYDPKDREPNKTNFISTYQSNESYSQTSTYTSDDFYGLLDNNEGGNITNSAEDLDVSIGRLPVETAQEAWEVVNKIKNYKRPQKDASCVEITSNNSWRNTLTFVADDEDGGVHLYDSETICEDARTDHPEYNFDKIYLDAFKQLPTPAGDRYPDVNTAILNKINSGTLVLNWIGHGGETNWAHERIFNQSEIVVLNNKEKLPLFITATCEFSRFDAPERTAGEWLIVNGKGGAIGSLTTVRLVYSNANKALNTKAFEFLLEPYNGKSHPTLGEMNTLTKNNVVTDITNTRKFTLLGDPAITLNYPQMNVATTAVNNVPVSSQADTLKALEEVTIKGEIRDVSNNKMTSFNGVVYPLVFDKITTQKTLQNDGSSPLVNFPLYKNILFKGKASVTNGEFSFSFIVPKDIDYQFGNGRISYYADNGNFIDGHGYTSNVIIGGSADSFTADYGGPQVDVFMNDEKFVFGGTTNQSPILLAKLADETGINTVGNGIGHDLTAILDDNTQNKIVLNDFYESELDNFRKGAVKYPFSKLADGPHTLKVKAWDIHNNSSEEYTEFIVASDAKLALSHVYNYPNPFTTRTQFMFEHNRACDDLKVSIQIYTVSGKVVKSIQRDLSCDGYRVNDIEWDGRDDYGDPIGQRRVCLQTARARFAGQHC